MTCHGNKWLPRADKTFQLGLKSQSRGISHVNLIRAMQQKRTKKLGWAQPGFEPAMTVLKNILGNAVEVATYGPLAVRW